MSPEHSIDIFLGLDVGKSEHHACAESVRLFVCGGLVYK